MAVMQPCKPWPGHCRKANRTRCFWNWPRNDSVESLHHVFAVLRCWQNSESALFDRCAHSIRKIPSLESRATVMITFKKSSDANMWQGDSDWFVSSVPATDAQILDPSSKQGSPWRQRKSKSLQSLTSVSEFVKQLWNQKGHIWKVQYSFESLSLSHSIFQPYVLQLCLPT